MLLLLLKKCKCIVKMGYTLLLLVKKYKNVAIMGKNCKYVAIMGKELLSMLLRYVNIQQKQVCCY